MVVDATGNGCPPGTVFLEGKLTAFELKEKALRALELYDFLDRYRVEVRDKNGEATKNITSDCIVFVSISPETPFYESSDFPEILRKFENIFGDK